MIFVTWLRDPVERLLSHYNFFERIYDPTKDGPLFKKIIEENWSLERFCFSQEYRNIYNKYLWKFAHDDLAFVGLSEYYEDICVIFRSTSSKSRLMHADRIALLKGSPAVTRLMQAFSGK